MSTGHSLLSVPSDYATNKSESRYRAHHGAEEILPNWLRKKIAMLEGNIARVLGQSEQLVPLVNEDELYEELQAFVQLNASNRKWSQQLAGQLQIGRQNQVARRTKMNLLMTQLYDKTNKSAQGQHSKLRSQILTAITQLKEYKHHYTEQVLKHSTNIKNVTFKDSNLIIEQSKEFVRGIRKMLEKQYKEKLVSQVVATAKKQLEEQVNNQKVNIARLFNEIMYLKWVNKGKPCMNSSEDQVKQYQQLLENNCERIMNNIEEAKVKKEMIAHDLQHEKKLNLCNKPKHKNNLSDNEGNSRVKTFRKQYKNIQNKALSLKGQLRNINSDIGYFRSIHNEAILNSVITSNQPKSKGRRTSPQTIKATNKLLDLEEKLHSLCQAAENLFIN